MPKARKADLPKGVSRSKEMIRGQTFFVVRLGKKFTGKTKAVRRRFRRQSTADEWIFGDAQKLKARVPGVIDLRARHGTEAFSLSSAEMAEASSAIAQCRQAGMTLSEAVELAILHRRPPSGPISGEEAVEKMIKEKVEDGASPAHTQELEKKIRRFLASLPPAKRREIASVGPLDVREYIDKVGKSDGNKKAIKRNLSPLFTWAVEHGHMAVNPCGGLKIGRRSKAGTKEKVNPDGEVVRIVRFKVSDLQKALKLAWEGFRLSAGNDPVERKRFSRRFDGQNLEVAKMDLIPWLTLGCFAGLRPEEAAKTTWGMIDLERNQIDLPARITKDREPRIVPIEPNLLEWLKACLEKDVPILPKNFRRKRQALTWALKWKEWPEDITRHSYGTFHLAKFKNAGLTAENMGHASPKMLRSRYRDVVKDTGEVEKYWSLLPSRA